MALSVGLRNKKVYILALFSFTLLIPNFLPIHLTALARSKAKWDQFDPKLAARLHTVTEILQYADSVARVQNFTSDTLRYAETIDNLLRRRFYHGYSTYSLRENWIAAVAGEIIFSDLSAIVLPNDILKYPMAACSQQSIVFMECFRRKRISFRKVTFTGHFALEGYINGKWLFFDTNLEPDFRVVPRSGIASIISHNELQTIYEGRLDSAQVKIELADQRFGEVNQPPAPRAALFHKATKFLSRTLWILPLIACFIFWRKNTKRADSEIH